MRPLRWAGDHSRVCLPLPCETDKLQSTPKLFKHKKDQCIDILYIYMLLTVVQLEHQFIPFKLWNAVFQFLPQYQNHSCAVKLNILILAENYKFLVTPDNSHIWISSYRLHRLSRSAQWKRLMWSVSFFRW